MFPRFQDVPRSELLSNKYFLQAAYNCFFGLTFMVKNIDDMALIDSLLTKFASSSYYINHPTAKQQLDETTRITLDVMTEELGSDVFTPEVRDAWKALLNHVHEVLANRNELAPLTADDIDVINTDWAIAKRGKKVGSTTMLK